jgi:hypothetical protein
MHYFSLTHADLYLRFHEQIYVSVQPLHLVNIDPVQDGIVHSYLLIKCLDAIVNHVTDIPIKNILAHL